MMRAELRRLLNHEHVRPDSYSLYGEVPDECLCVLPEPGGWVVFYSERGERTFSEVLVFDYYGSWSEAPGDHLITPEQAADCVRAFFDSGSPATTAVLFSPD
jgi:hypothetical protein